MKMNNIEKTQVIHAMAKAFGQVLTKVDLSHPDPGEFWVHGDCEHCGLATSIKVKSSGLEWASECMAEELQVALNHLLRDPALFGFTRTDLAVIADECWKNF